MLRRPKIFLAANALLLLLSAGCAHNPSRVAVPAQPSGPYAWQPAKSVPPDGCATSPAAAKGAPSQGEVEGTVSAPTAAAETAPDKWPANLAIRPDDVKNFSGKVHPRVLKSGATVYRVIGSGGNPAGAYWSDAPPPPSEAEWRAKYAVFSWWNGASCLERYVVPKKRVLYVWEGTVGPQADEGRAGYELTGGAWQIWIPASATQIDASRIEYARTPWTN